MTRVGANTLRSGSEGALRTNIANKPLNFVRTIFQEARNQAEVMSKQYITNKENGIISLLKKLSQEEKDSLAEMLLALDRNQKELTPDIMERFGMTESQKAVAGRIKEALDARYASVSEALGKQGFSAFEPRKGYFPSMFSGAYTSLVGFYDKAGEWHTTGVAQADTAYGHKQALAKYAEMGDNYKESIKLPRKGLNSYVGHNRTYNGFTDLVAELAKKDQAFAEAKAIVDQHIKDQTAALYRFDVHELKKSGIKGSLGDRPWLSRKENTQQMFEALVDYLEQGFRYDSLQAPMNEVGQLLADPNMQQKLPNTAKYIQKYVDHVSGVDLNPIGAGVNYFVDNSLSAMGLGPKGPRALINGAQQMSTSLMMGCFNFGFGMMQLAQLPQAMAIEGAAVREVMGIPHTQAVHSAATAGFAYPIAIATAKMMKKEIPSFIPNHIVHAYEWAAERGMFDYSEAELVHNLNKSNARVKIEGVINASISVPEKMTRPTMFLFMSDLFHKAGFYGEDGLLRAQAATDYAMVNYHGDERPGIYSSLGQAGQLLGALSTFKHNLVEQTVSRTALASPIAIEGKQVGNLPVKLPVPKFKKPQQVESFAAGLTTGVLLYGAMGMPGSQEMDNLIQWLTNKSVREWVLSDPKKHSVLLDGAMSTWTNTDIQTRVAASSLLPDSPLNALPHVSNEWNILSSAAEAAWKQDEASLRELAYKGMPASGRNIFEATALTDTNGWVTNPKGERKVERPRTPEETATRAILGLRPLDERLAADQVWVDKKRQTRNEQRLAGLEKDFENAVRLDGNVGTILQQYKELGGDPNVLLNRVDTIKKEAVKTPKQRAQGEPNGSLESFRRYNSYNH
jgi:hypothetical protein